MKSGLKKSFHRQLLVCFAVVALLPVIVSSVSLIQTMETKINSDYEKNVTEQAQQIDTVYWRYLVILRRWWKISMPTSKSWTISMKKIPGPGAKYICSFYREVSDYREYAQFDLYDRNGKCIYTTDREMPEWNCRFTGEF